VCDAPGTRIDPFVDVEAHSCGSVVVVGKVKVRFQGVICCRYEPVSPRFLDCDNVVFRDLVFLEQTG
jgi:hypothetical protein